MSPREALRLAAHLTLTGVRLGVAVTAHTVWWAEHRIFRHAAR